MESLGNRWWARAGGVFAMANGLWFLWSSVLIEQFRASARVLSRLPVTPWTWATVVASWYVGVQALRRDPRGRSGLVVVGAMTVLLSGFRVRATPWALVPVALGLAMCVTAARWKPDAT